MARSDLDPKKLYEAYKRNPANQGLGSMFREEGPGMGPSAGFLRRPGDIFATKGLVDRIADARRNYAREIEEDPNMAAAMESYIGDLREADEEKKLGQLGGLQRALRKMRLEQGGPNFRSPEDGISDLVQDQRRAAEAERMDVSRPDSPMTLGLGANELSPLDQIAEQLSNLSKPKDITGSGRGSVVEKPGERSQYNAEQAINNKMDADNLANLGTPDEDPEEVVEDTFMSGMSEVFKALQKPVPELGDRDEMLQKYKDEFAEATGINIDGKPNKGEALMAVGLALMQNRAGKGFNVGKIFNAIGEAGMTAMPYLTKAKDEAKQAAIAAGKYALEKIKSDEDARSAVISANQALAQELAIENLKHRQKMQQIAYEAELEGNEPKKVEALKSVGDLKIRIGSQDMILKRGENIEDEGRVVWQDPIGDSKNIATAYRKTTGGLNSIARMNDLLDLMESEAEGQVGGTAAQGLLDRAKAVAKSIGMDIGPYTGGEDVSPREQYEKLSNALLANFKRYLTSETGNGISTYDVKQIEAALGKFGTFDDIKGARMALNEILPMFTASLNTLEPIVEQFSNRNEYRKGSVGDEQYTSVMEYFSREFGASNLIQPTEVTLNDGTVVIEYDVSY